MRHLNKSSTLDSSYEVYVCSMYVYEVYVCTCFAYPSVVKKFKPAWGWRPNTWCNHVVATEGDPQPHHLCGSSMALCGSFLTSVHRQSRCRRSSLLVDKILWICSNHSFEGSLWRVPVCPWSSVFTANVRFCSEKMITSTIVSFLRTLKYFSVVTRGPTYWWSTSIYDRM